MTTSLRPNRINIDLQDYKTLLDFCQAPGTTPQRCVSPGRGQVWERWHPDESATGGKDSVENGAWVSADIQTLWD